MAENRLADEVAKSSECSAAVQGIQKRKILIKIVVNYEKPWAQNLQNAINEHLQVCIEY